MLDVTPLRSHRERREPGRGLDTDSTMEEGLGYQEQARRRCSAVKTRLNTGPAPVTPETPRIGALSKFPTQTPTVNSGV